MGRHEVYLFKLDLSRVRSANYPFVPVTAADVAAALSQFLSDEEKRNGGPLSAIDPGHRHPFIWPRHSVAAQYNVKVSDFSRTVRMEVHGEAFEVQVAETPFGVFGRCEALQGEAKGANEQQMLRKLRHELEPLFERQFAISRTLNLPRRFEGAIQDLPPTDLVKLLYCIDRDVASCAMIAIDANARSGIYGKALAVILNDRSHPNRRIAQWCALDILEDLPNLSADEDDRRALIEAIQNFMLETPDDYARAVYKAGDVLGDHVANEDALDVLLNVLKSGKHAPGRRSAIHGLIHLCEWMPAVWGKVKPALEWASTHDQEPLLREYVLATIQDITSGEPHGPEPVLPSEIA